MSRVKTKLLQPKSRYDPTQLSLHGRRGEKDPTRSIAYC